MLPEVVGVGVLGCGGMSGRWTRAAEVTKSAQAWRVRHVPSMLQEVRRVWLYT